MTALNLQIRLDGDLEALRMGLEEWLRGLPDLATRRPALDRLRYVTGSGSANVTITGDLTDAAGCREAIVVRLPAADLTPYLDRRLERQTAIIKWVSSNTDVPVPAVIGADDSGSVVGRPFMMMHRIDGQAPIDFPGYNITGFLTDLAPDARHALWESAMTTLGELARVDASTIDFLDFPGIGEARLPHLLEHWRNSVDWAAEDLDHTYFNDVHRWLTANMPADAPAGLSWGDARVGNMLFNQGRCVAVLDWEMASLGGPVLDLAWWLLFDRIQDLDSGVERLSGLGTREQTIERWEQLTMLSTRSLRWYEILAHFQLGVTRSRAFGHRRRQGLLVPDENDPRSVRRLRSRIDDMISKDRDSA